MTPLEARLVTALGAHPEVVVAYLYGSHARGRETVLSDVDVGVVLDDGCDAHDARLELLAELGEITAPARVDVVVLNDAPVALGYRVLRDGRLLLCRDDAARVRHFTRTVDRYLDMAPMRKILAAGTTHRLEEKRFGRS